MVVVPSNIIDRFGLTTENLEKIDQDHLHREQPSAVAAFAALVWGFLDGMMQKIDIFSSTSPAHTNTARATRAAGPSASSDLTLP